MMMPLMLSILLLGPLVSAAQESAKGSSKPVHFVVDRVEITSKASTRALAIRTAQAPLSVAELAISERVFQGRLPCELGTIVLLTADKQAPGYFDLRIRSQKHRMSPVETRTGAIRLEDRQSGAVWLQLSNKSMLMNQKLGQRLADVCMSPEQALVAQRLADEPAAGLLDTALEVARQ